GRAALPMTGRVSPRCVPACATAWSPRRSATRRNSRGISRLPIGGCGAIAAPPRRAPPDGGRGGVQTRDDLKLASAPEFRTRKGMLDTFTYFAYYTLFEGSTRVVEVFDGNSRTSYHRRERGRRRAPVFLLLRCDSCRANRRRHQEERPRPQRSHFSR